MTQWFQPFLRFWLWREVEGVDGVLSSVSTLLEILAAGASRKRPNSTAKSRVSTLLEILAYGRP